MKNPKDHSYVRLDGKTPRTNVPHVDDLPEVVPVVAEPLARTEDGKIASSEAAKELGRRGGLARANKRKLLTEIGLKVLADSAEFAPYNMQAKYWFQAYSEELSFQCGGFLGPGPLNMLRQAAMQHAISLYSYDKLAETASLSFHEMNKKAGEAMRQHILAATSLARQDAAIRAKSASEQTFFDPFSAKAEDSGS